MPRGAQVVYPKDAGQVVQMADIFPGAHVVEAGVGSGALSMSLLRAVGDRGRLSSYERRAGLRRRSPGPTSSGSSAARTRPGRVTVGDLQDALVETDVDRVVLDMLAPWETLDAVARALRPGGLVCCYVATTTQLSTTVEALRAHGSLHRAAVVGVDGARLARRGPRGPARSTGWSATPASCAPAGASPTASSRRCAVAGPSKGAYGEPAAESRPGRRRTGATREPFRPDLP